MTKRRTVMSILTEMQKAHRAPHPVDPSQLYVKSTVGVEPAVPLTVAHGKDYREAIARAMNKDQVKSRKLQEQRMRAVRAGADERILAFTDLMYARMDRIGIPVFATEIMRSAERQEQLFLDGFSKVRVDGKHTRGLAVDIVHSIYAWDMSTEEWSFFGAVGKELAIQRGIRINWGGNDGPGDRFNWDPAHWELKE